MTARTFVFVLAALCAAAFPASAGEWVKLGEKTVDFGGDRDTLTVTGAEGRFTKLKFKAEQNGIVLDWIRVNFRNGETHEYDPNLNLQLQKGSESRVFDLPGAQRVIRTIEFRYRTRARRPGRGKARLLVFGKQAEGAALPGPAPADTPPVAAPVQEWVSLGEKKVGFGVDKDTIAVTGREGRFTKVKFKVSENPIVLGWIKIHFRNGETHEINPDQPIRIERGATTRPLDLPGGTRVIRAIEFKYSTANRRAGRGKAHVEAIGLRVGGDPTPRVDADDRPGGQADDAGADRGWTKLGEKKVGFGVDTDTIPVTGLEGLFTKIRFRVSENAVILDWIKVHFRNGETHEFDRNLNLHLKEGATSRAFDLPGARRVIRSIELKYRTPLRRALGGKAHVSVFGFRASQDPTPNNGR